MNLGTVVSTLVANPVPDSVLYRGRSVARSVDLPHGRGSSPTAR